MHTVPRVSLTGKESLADLQALGMGYSTAFAARKRGWYCPGYHHYDYPQHEGPGHYGCLDDPRGFVIHRLAMGIREGGGHVDPHTFRDWTQELLCEIWRRRHAPHIIEDTCKGYYAKMIFGLVREWMRVYRSQQAQLTATGDYPLTVA